MNRLLIKGELDLNISKAEFLSDIDCLFDALREAYGLYDYFGHEAFMKAKDEILTKLDAIPFDGSCAVRIVQDTFASFIKDGHFAILSGVSVPDELETIEAEPDTSDFAIRHTSLHGIPMIQCRKFYFDTPEEQAELEEFSRSFPRYQNDDPLIIDVRDNGGGSDIYFWDFFKGLFGAEPDFPCSFVQRYSPLYREYREANHWEQEGAESEDCDGVTIKSPKQMYILVNEKTASSAESAVAYLKTVENALVVGTHTAGCYSCGNCMMIYLPNSHLPVYFGTGMVLYEKTRNIDAEGGFQADISYEEFLQKIGV